MDEGCGFLCGEPDFLVWGEGVKERRPHALVLWPLGLREEAEHDRPTRLDAALVVDPKRSLPLPLPLSSSELVFHFWRKSGRTSADLDTNQPSIALVMSGNLETICFHHSYNAND
jgi:hypothetical protein